MPDTNRQQLIRKAIRDGKRAAREHMARRGVRYPDASDLDSAANMYGTGWPDGKPRTREERDRANAWRNAFLDEIDTAAMGGH